MKTQAIAKGSLVVLILLVSVAVFAVYFNFFSFINNSFPSNIKPFQNYASVESYSFNGTLLKIVVNWKDTTNTVPIYTQFVSDQYTSAVYNIDKQFYPNGTLILPFPIAVKTDTLSNIQLLIAVKYLVNSTEFTIVYDLGNTKVSK